MKRRITKDGNAKKPAGANRRDFLKTSALVAGYGVWVANESGNVAFGQQAANDKVNVAWVGSGGKGGGDIDQVAKIANIVAVCDTDQKVADAKAKQHTTKDGKGPKVYNDWRKLLDEMGKEIDAVGVSIPDHSHAIVAVHAMRMGKHIYSQKPLTHSIAEARLMRETAAEHKVVTQMGNQGTASAGLRTGVEVIQSGMMGKIHEVHVWTNRPIWPQAPDVMDWPKGESTPPSNINWDVWTGPAPEHPYSDAYATFKWRGYWDFGTGALGDMGCHTFNMPFMGLNMREQPVTRVKGVCADLNPVSYPAWASVEYDIPARGDLPPLKVYWYEGHFGFLEKTRGNNGQMAPNRLKNLPPMHLFKGKTPSQSGSLTVGENSTLYSPQDYGGSWSLLGKEGAVEMEFREPGRGGQGGGVTTGKAPEKTLPRFDTTRDDDNQKLEWINAIQGKGKTLSNFDYASRLVELILLGNVAIRVPGQPLDWDSAKMAFTNNPFADKYVSFNYRNGWSL